MQEKNWKEQYMESKSKLNIEHHTRVIQHNTSVSQPQKGKRLCISITTHKRRHLIQCFQFNTLLMNIWKD